MIMKNIDFFLHESSMIDADVVIGKNTKIWHFSHIQTGSKIGSNCSIGQNVNIGNNVIIGNGVKIQNNVSVYEGVELEDYVFCGPSMVFTNVKIPRSEFPQRGTEFYMKTFGIRNRLPEAVDEGLKPGLRGGFLSKTYIGQPRRVVFGV